MKNWLQEGGALDEQETAEDLYSVEYRVKLDGKIVLEPKEDVKERLGRSPGCGDALALTFAAPVMKRNRMPQGSNAIPQGRTVTDYDPFR